MKSCAVHLLTALLARDPLAARQTTLLQLEETRGDLEGMLEDAG